MNVNVAFHRSRAARHRGDVLARAIHESILETGRGSELVGDARLISDSEPVIVIGNSGLLTLKRKRSGPVIQFNLDETFIDDNWARRIEGKFVQNPFAKIDVVFDYSPDPLGVVEAAGYRRVYCPIGYHQSFERRDYGVAFSQDVGFVGRCDKGGRRWKLVSKIPDDISLMVHQKECADKRHPERRDDPRDAMNSRIMIHMHQLDCSQNFPAMRVILIAMSNRIPVLMEETSWMPDGMKIGEHLQVFKQGSGRSMVGALREMLSSPGETAAMGDRGHRFIAGRWRLVDHVDRALTEIGM